MSSLARILDEIALAGSEHLDTAYVAGYDRKAAFDAGADLAVLRDRGLGRQSTVVDLGAGTGTFALAAARECKRVVAVDVSPAMINAIESRTNDERIENVEIVRAGFLTYDHTGEPADFVYTRNALHHLPDLWKALAIERIARVLRPDGVLRLRDLAFSFEPHEAERVIGAWLDGAAVRPEEGWTREEYEVHLRDEHSTFAWLLEPMLERAGFSIDEADYDVRGVFADYVCTKRP